MEEDKRVRVGIHLQLQKIGRSELHNKKLIKSFINHPDYEEITDLNVVGLDLTVLENQALHGILVLLEETDWKGNMLATYVDSPEFGFKGELPVIRFTPAQFYEAFGLERHETKSGKKQFRGGDREHAMEALDSLINRRYVLSYTQSVFPEDKIVKKPKKQFIKDYRCLFGNVKKTYLKDVNGREYLDSITMLITPIFITQRETLHVLKPIDYIKQIKGLYPRASEYVFRFIEHVLNQARLNKTDEGIVGFKESTLAYQLRLHAYIENKKWAEIRKIINKGLEVAKKIDFITDYSHDQGWVEFTINREKFPKVEDKI